jgi:prophage regulatory protein
MSDKDNGIIRGFSGVREATGLSRFTVHRRIKDGTFPAPIELGSHSVGWYRAEIEAWKASRPRRTYGARIKPDDQAA